MVLSDCEWLCLLFRSDGGSADPVHQPGERQLLPPGFPLDQPQSATNILQSTDGHEVLLMSKSHLHGGPSHIGVQVLLRLSQSLSSKAGATETDTDHCIVLGDTPTHISY